MSEQHRRINWSHKISTEGPEEVLRMSIPVIALASQPGPCRPEKFKLK